MTAPTQLLLLLLLVLAVPLSVPLLLLFFGLMRNARDPLRDIPGPVLARWSPLWLAYHARRGRRFRAVHDAHQRYGPYVRIAPHHISIADPTAIPIVYATFGAGALPKSAYYDAFVADATPSVFSVRDNAAHAAKRRLLSHAFSVRALHGFAPLVRGMVEAFVQRLDGVCCEGGGPVDMMEWLNYLAFDIISDLAFGEPLGMVEKGSDVIEVKTPDGTVHRENAIQLVDNREHLAAVLGIMPSLSALSLLGLIPDPFFKRGRASAHGLAFIARQGVQRRLATGCGREDILNALIAARRADKDALGEDEIQELTAEAVTILIAGTHTGASSMAAILHLLRSHDTVYATLLAELDEHVGAGEIPSYEQVRHLPYLQATITEGLRVHATNAIGLPRTAPAGGVTCGGIFFPEGTELSVPAWTIQHDAALWRDPHAFRPERWLAPDADADIPAMRRHMLSFGAGPRTCLGKHIANMEMLVILATLLLRYDITLARPGAPLETHEGFQHQPVRMAVFLEPRARGC